MKAKEVWAGFKRIFIKRKYKDILFRYVFRDKEEILQLYNAINHTNYTSANELVITTMEDVIYVGMKNDLSFIIVNELNLYEHQSTINENMPLRGLLYFAKLYESYLDMCELNRHQRKRIPLPFPRFVVFYNGEQKVPEVFEMRLSDSFDKKGEEPAVECVAKVININYGHNEELMNSCKRLHDYSFFVAAVRRKLRQGCGKKEAVSHAVDECIEKGILKDVLLKHRAEVEDMFLTTFDKKMYEEAVRMDARADGLEEGRAIGIKIGLEEGRKEGRKEGREEGRKEGRKEGREEGREEGRNNEATENARNLFANGVEYEVVRASIKTLSDEELRKIFDEVND